MAARSRESTEARFCRAAYLASWLLFLQLPFLRGSIGAAAVYASLGSVAVLVHPPVAADIAQANQRFMDKIGVMPELFAYPFGEYSADLQKIITRYRYSAAFGQHSGVIYPGANYFALPRYPLVESYSNMARFQTVVDTSPWFHNNW